MYASINTFQNEICVLYLNICVCFFFKDWVQTTIMHILIIWGQFSIALVSLAFRRLVAEFFPNFVYLEKATLFKSALMPAKFTFKTVDDKEYIVSEKILL